MSANCLVTELLGSVQNDNLPSYGIITLDYTPTSGTNALLIKSGANETFLKFKEKVHGSAPGSADYDTNYYYEWHIAAGAKKVLYFDASTLATEKIVEIHNIYDVAEIIPYSNCLSFSPNPYTNLQALMYNDNILWTGGMGMDLSLVPENLVRLSIDREDTSEILNMDEIFSRNVIQIVNRTDPFAYGGGPFLELNDVTKLNTSIRAIGMRPKGSIVNIPINTVGMYFRTSECYGNIEDFIARARSAGRTSGSIMFKNKADWHVSYNGAYLRELPAAIENPMFSWDASTISLITTATDEITTVDTNFRAQYAWAPLS